MEISELSPKNVAIEIKALRTRCSELERRLASLENIVSSAKEHLTLEEAAAFLGCTRSLLYKMTHERTIPFYKPSGKMVYFEKSELVKWITQNKTMSNSELDAAANSIIARHSVK